MTWKHKSERRCQVMMIVARSEFITRVVEHIAMSGQWKCNVCDKKAKYFDSFWKQEQDKDKLFHIKI